MIKIKQHGLYRTGTNYLAKSLTDNYEVEVLVNDKGWKHGCLSTIHDFPILVNTKNPYAWLASIYRFMGRDSKESGIDSSMSEFLRSRFLKREIIALPRQESTHFRMRSANPIQAWNDFYYHWTSLEGRTVYLCDYQSLISNTEAECDRIASWANLEKKEWSPVDLEVLPSLDGRFKSGDAFKRKEYFLNNDFMSAFSSDDLEFISNQLDPDVMSKLGYNAWSSSVNINIASAGIGDVVCSLPAIKKYISENPDAFVSVSTRRPQVLKGVELDRVSDSPLSESLNLNVLPPDEHSLHHTKNLSIQESSAEQLGVSVDKFELSPLWDDGSYSGVASKLNIDTKGKLVCFSPYTRWDSKKWDDSKWDKVWQKFIKESPDTSVVMTHSEEVENTPEGVINACGILSMREYISLIANCDCFVGVDTGGMHIARSFGKPVVSIFGPVPSNLRLDYGAVQSDKGCHSCMLKMEDIGDNHKPRKCPLSKHECMENISVDDVYQRVEEALNSSDEGYLVFATSPKFHRLAENLLASIRHNDPTRPVCLVHNHGCPESVVDKFDKSVSGDFKGFSGEKLDLYEYSPFKRTMFIDADCLMVKPDMDNWWSAFRGKEFVTDGIKRTEGDWHYDIPWIMSKLDIKYVIGFNSGVLYWEKSEKAKAIFDLSIQYSKELPLTDRTTRNGKPMSDPFLSLAMSKLGVSPIGDLELEVGGNRGRWCKALDNSQIKKLDCLGGECFIDKGNGPVSPSILHFIYGSFDGDHQREYDREVARLIPGRGEVTIILLNWKRPQNIKQIIWGLRNQTKSSHIWLYNNGKKLDLDVDKLYHSEGNDGCWARWEIAKSEVETEFVMVMDDDISVVDECLIQNCIDVSKYKPNQGIIGPYGVKLSANNYTESNHIGDVNKRTEVDLIKGRLMFLRTSSLKSLDLDNAKSITREDDIAISKMVSGSKVVAKIFTGSLRHLSEGGEALWKRPDHFGLRDRAISLLGSDYEPPEAHKKLIGGTRLSLSNSAILVIAVRNAERFIGECLDSVLSQDYKDLGVILIDDASEDDTLKIARNKLRMFRDVLVMSNPKPQSKTKSWTEAVGNLCSDSSSVIFWLDGDDFLTKNNAVSKIMSLHDDYDVVWSQFEYSGKSSGVGFCGPWDGPPRNSKWFASHLKTFKKFLFDSIRDVDLRDDKGEYYYTTIDKAIMWPILEMAGESKSHFHNEVLYSYRDHNNCMHRGGGLSEKQIEIENHLRGLPPYSPLKGESVTVVIPCHNHAKYLDRCISSIRMQNIDVEIIVVNDGGKDNCVDEAKRLGVKVIDQNHMGLPSARNTGISKANTEFVFLLDADDQLGGPRFLENCLKISKDADVVYTDIRKTSTGKVYNMDLDLPRLREENTIAACCLVRKSMWEKIGGYDESLTEGYEDWDFWISCVKYGARFKKCDGPLVIVDDSHKDRMTPHVQKVDVFFKIKGELERKHPSFFNESTGLSVVVSSYNQRDTLEMALESYYMQTLQPLEVIVADDGSTDGTLEWLDSTSDRYPFPVRYVTRQHSAYRLASVNNLAAKEAKGSRILFTNGDQIHNITSFESHMSLSDSDVGGGIFKGIVESVASGIDINMVRNTDEFVKLAEENLSGKTNLSYIEQTDPNVNPIGVWGGNFSVPASMFHSVKYDEGYDVGWGGEENDLVKRMCQSGCKVVWVDGSTIYHLDHPIKTYACNQKGSKKYCGIE